MSLPKLLLSLCLAVVPAVCVAATPPRVMLASTYEAGIAVDEYWVSEKLDGVRGRWDGQRLWTRGGQPIAAPAWFTKGWPATPMDGELWLGRGRFEDVSVLVRLGTPDAPAWRGLRFMVFDLPAHGGRFGARVEAMRSLLGKAAVPWLQPVKQYRVADAAALDRMFDAVVTAGGEGLMLHHRDARYGAGRSEWLLKYKPYDDAEARVVGHTAGTGKYTGMLGALVVERPDGLRFRLGSGFSDAQRADPPPLGAWVTYRHNGLTTNGVPRFARFLRVRHEFPPPDPEG
ncbi:DNA ligase [Lysobacter arseniciresistens ZS79]|uniref:DNA ligase n=1 Tax=Lysobacter arseniciresistens ZS79 TaxID=913325 RepID=A0A0A0F522_9GAMM|nr:DNA ligase [Lysobacter arseniciresistens]KGM57463.1 DNA ligase [Lysobacter arseniciresistens ZS79]